MVDRSFLGGFQMKVLFLVLFLVACGSKEDGQNIVDLNKPSTSYVGPKTVVQLEACTAFNGEEYCYCLNRVASKACERFITHASNEYNDCIQPFLDDAYHGYCTISKQWAVQVQRQGGF